MGIQGSFSRGAGKGGGGEGARAKQEPGRSSLGGGSETADVPRGRPRSCAGLCAAADTGNTAPRLLGNRLPSRLDCVFSGATGMSGSFLLLHYTHRNSCSIAGAQ